MYTGGTFPEQPYWDYARAFLPRVLGRQVILDQTQMVNKTLGAFYFSFDLSRDQPCYP